MRWIDKTPEEREADLAKSRRLREEHDSKFGEIEAHLSSQKNRKIGAARLESERVRFEALGKLSAGAKAHGMSVGEYLEKPGPAEKWFEACLESVKIVLAEMVRESVGLPETFG